MKRGIIWDTLIPWIIGAVVLVLVLIFYFALRNSGSSAFDFLKDLLRFGR